MSNKNYDENVDRLIVGDNSIKYLFDGKKSKFKYESEAELVHYVSSIVYMSRYSNITIYKSIDRGDKKMCIKACEAYADDGLFSLVVVCDKNQVSLIKHTVKECDYILEKKKHQKVLKY